MNELPHAASESTPSPARPRGHALLAWIAIAAMTAATVYWQNAAKFVLGGDGQNQAVQLILLEFWGRLYTALPKMADPADPKAAQTLRDNTIQALNALNRGSLDQRFGALIALGEVDGPKTALAGLEELSGLLEQAEVPPSETDKQLLDILTRLYTDYLDGRPAAPTIAPPERELLVRRLGWFGELALHPEPPEGEPVSPERAKLLAEAEQTLNGLFIIAGVVVVGLLLGLAGLATMAVLAARGRLRSRLGGPVAHHAIYAETFAIWLIFFGGLVVGLPVLIAGRLPLIAQQAAPMALGLVILAWPVARGIPWKQVRQDIGLHFGETPLLEPILGFVSYVNTLPFIIVGIVVFALLTMATRGVPTGPANPFAPDPGMAHPLIEQLRNADPGEVFSYFLLVCVLAPITEEIFFRGCLYRHMRDATRGLRGGVLVSFLVVSVLFAAVHPQGVLAIPILASVAFGLTLAREWRGSLVSGIIAHGLNNSLVLAFVFLCLTRW